MSQWDKTIEANYKPVLSHYDVTALALHNFIQLKINKKLNEDTEFFDSLVQELIDEYKSNDSFFNAAKFKDLIYHGNPE